MWRCNVLGDERFPKITGVGFSPKDAYNQWKFIMNLEVGGDVN